MPTAFPVLHYSENDMQRLRDKELEGEKKALRNRKEGAKQAESTKFISKDV